MKNLGYNQLQLSQKIIKTEGYDSEMLLPESDKDELGQILNTEDSRGKPMKELRFSLKNQVWLFDTDWKQIFHFHIKKQKYNNKIIKS